jgi:putative transposase
MLEEENARLKRIVADLTLDRHILQEVLRKKSVKPARRRELAHWIREQVRGECAAGVPARVAAPLDLG